jgi:hypothetical protein
VCLWSAFPVYLYYIINQPNNNPRWIIVLYFDWGLLKGKISICYCTSIFGLNYWYWFLKNITYEWLHPIRTQNITLFYSNVWKQRKGKQTLWNLKTWIKLNMWYHGWSVLAPIALTMNLRVVTFPQPHPSVFTRGGESALLLLILLIAALNVCNHVLLNTADLV